MAQQSKKSLKSLKRYFALVNAAKTVDMLPEDDRLGKRVVTEIQRQQVAIERRENVETNQKEDDEKRSMKTLNETQKQRDTNNETRPTSPTLGKRLEDDKLSRRVVNEIEKQQEANDKRAATVLRPTSPSTERKNLDDKLSVKVVQEIQKQQQAISLRPENRLDDKQAPSPNNVDDKLTNEPQLVGRQDSPINRVAKDGKKLKKKFVTETKFLQIDTEDQPITNMAQQREDENQGLSEKFAAQGVDKRGLSDKFALQEDKPQTNAKEKPSENKTGSPQADPNDATQTSPSSPKDTKKSPKSPGRATETHWSYKRTHRRTRTTRTKSSRSSKSAKSAKSIRSPR